MGWKRKWVRWRHEHESEITQALVVVVAVFLVAALVVVINYLGR